jgi:porphobilinogen synthase
MLLEQRQTLLSLSQRPRRNRHTAAIRALVEETNLRPADLVAPFFLLPGEKRKDPIATLPGVARLSLDHVLREAEALHRQGIPAIALFPVIDPDLKDAEGNETLNGEGLIPQAIRQLKKEIPSLCVIADVALDPYTSHGHDGIADDRGHIVNDATVEVLAKMAVVLAQAGVDIVAPSDMMDGRVGVMRQALDQQGFSSVGILSYTAKYASSLYAPFREALGSTLKFGDKKTYQMNPANSREALREARLDVAEGADMLMVKPALLYLDVIAKLKEATDIPICAYHVSGEYAMVMAAHEKGYLNASKVFFESLLSIKRAGADFIFTYAVPDVLPLLK